MTSSSSPSSSTTLLDQELIYHIGANSQPISFEWTRHTGTGESQTTTTSTYYYHYDVHGNTLKVTDTNQDTKITYTYDTLGNITSQTNPDSIPNPFTFMGASQTILDTETGLYFSSGYYNPQTGTLLQGTGSPAMPNPTSISTINSMSTSSLPEQQLLSHSITSATTAGSSSGGEPGSFAPPPGPSDGISHSGRQSGPPSLDYSNPDARLVGAKDVGEKNINGIICTNGSAEDGGDILKRNGENLGFMFNDNCGETSKEYEERKKAEEDLRDGQIITDEGFIYKFANEMPAIVSKGIMNPFAGMSSILDILNDMDPDDDCDQYVWVIRDKDGKIVACQTKDKNDRNPSKTYMFDVNDDGTRKGSGTLSGAGLSEKEAAKKNVDNWEIICESVANKEATVKMFDNSKNGNLTNGIISMNVGGGDWLGIFVTSPGGSEKNSECQVARGKRSDMGFPASGQEDMVGTMQKGDFLTVRQGTVYDDRSWTAHLQHYSIILDGWSGYYPLDLDLTPTPSEPSKLRRWKGYRWDLGGLERIGEDEP